MLSTGNSTTGSRLSSGSGTSEVLGRKLHITVDRRQSSAAPRAGEPSEIHTAQGVGLDLLSGPEGVLKAVLARLGNANHANRSDLDWQMQIEVGLADMDLAHPLQMHL